MAPHHPTAETSPHECPRHRLGGQRRNLHRTRSGGKNLSRLRRGLTVAVIAAGGLVAIPSAAATPASNAPVRDISSHAEADPDAEGYDRFIVSYRPGTAKTGEQQSTLQEAAREADVAVEELRTTATGSHVVGTDLKLSPEAAEEFMAELESSEAVEYVEPDVRMTIALAPRDARYAELWGLNGTNGIRVPTAWRTTTGRGTVVAVLDTGITAHPDLNANLVPGYDFVSNPAQARDGNGRDANPADTGDWFTAGECGSSRASSSSWHGTHVAGTVGAVANATGVVGVAPHTRIQPVRVLAKCGGALSDIADAIVWASGGHVPGVPANRTPADVINMSLGGAGRCSVTYQNAINSAVSRGATVVVAAGNESQNAGAVQPASCNNVVTVASSTHTGGLSYFSNYGSVVDLTAPGGDLRTRGGGVLSTVNTGSTTPSSAGYAAHQGTSMAAPHVAGVAALLKSRAPSMSPARVESTLKSGTRPLPFSCSGGCGTGLLDAGRALSLVGR